MEPRHCVKAAKQFLPFLPAAQYPHLRSLTEKVIARQHSGQHDFQFGLHLLLKDLEASRGGRVKLS